MNKSKTCSWISVTTVEAKAWAAFVYYLLWATKYFSLSLVPWKTLDCAMIFQCFPLCQHSRLTFLQCNLWATLKRTRWIFYSGLLAFSFQCEVSLSVSTELTRKQFVPFTIGAVITSNFALESHSFWPEVPASMRKVANSRTSNKTKREFRCKSMFPKMQVSPDNVELYLHDCHSSRLCMHANSMCPSCIFFQICRLSDQVTWFRKISFVLVRGRRGNEVWTSQQQPTLMNDMVENELSRTKYTTLTLFNRSN